MVGDTTKDTLEALVGFGAGVQIPKLRAQTFNTTIIERYRRRESLVEGISIEMYLAAASVHRSKTSRKPCGVCRHRRRRSRT